MEGTGVGAGAIGGGAVAIILVGLLVWVVKKVIPAIISQNREVVTEALNNMKANTSAIEANTRATDTLARNLDKAAVIRDERDRSLFKQLDRIEKNSERAARGKPDSDTNNPRA